MSLPKFNHPELLKLAGFALMVGAAFFAPTRTQVPLFIGAVAVALGYLWSRQ